MIYLNAFKNFADGLDKTQNSRFFAKNIGLKSSTQFKWKNLLLFIIVINSDLGFRRYPKYHSYMNVFFFSCLSGYIHISISELTVIQYSCLYSSKSLGRCNQTSNDSYGIFCQFPMEIFHCVFTSFYAIFICNHISNGTVYISWIALAVYDYMDFPNGTFINFQSNLYNI